jgi:ankyrin repeat protein
MRSEGAHVPGKATTPEREIIKAVKSGDEATVRRLLAEQPALVHTTDADGSTPLHYAAWKGRKEIAALLLEAGAGVNVQNSNGHWGGTPLHAAAHANERQVAELLIRHGGDLCATSCNGRTPLQETGIHSASAVANLLKQHGASE